MIRSQGCEIHGIVTNIYRWPRIEACLNLTKQSCHLLRALFGRPDDSFEMVLHGFDTRFPPTSHFGDNEVMKLYSELSLIKYALSFFMIKFAEGFMFKLWWFVKNSWCDIGKLIEKNKVFDFHGQEIELHINTVPSEEKSLFKTCAIGQTRIF